MFRPWFAIVALASLGCGPSTKPEPAEPETETADPEGGPRTAGANDAPEISRSLGAKGGVLVFWPRIIPATEDPTMRELAGKLQKRVSDVAGKAASGKPVDVRPEPERVCPQDGCDAMTVGALLVHKEGGCTVLALVSAPGEAPMKLVPWAGVMKLKADSVPFREPPENQLTVRDAVPCAELIDRLAEHEADVAAAISQTASAP
jgi:hypothetical protein